MALESRLERPDPEPEDAVESGDAERAARDWRWPVLRAEDEAAVGRVEAFALPLGFDAEAVFVTAVRGRGGTNGRGFFCFTAAAR